MAGYAGRLNHGTLLKPKSGFERNVELSLPGTATVVQLREK